ncbi:GFA family protein [Pelagovum pacificum]|uniref:GFA family protein n=1 Tax=Pelagovum pacificum TaxID=2588711 RepID=A0A5C5GEG1_9RHOB|nr:GFA family protein [Pelagovum pacificum]QQA44456.1 GFA family protein [Pelagovum pacificum]TNY32427.1 GFA family protein [Pelagovum pacificum]
MPVTLSGSCRCGAVSFTVASHAPVPYQRCYCSICRKTGGGGGYAVNISAISDTLSVEGEAALGTYRAEIEGEVSKGERRYCTRCATALWLFDPRWPELLHPFASAIDSALPVPPSLVHLMLDFKPDWVIAEVGPEGETYARYPEKSLEAWHREKGLWVD